jgi:oligoribonuclease
VKELCRRWYPGAFAKAPVKKTTHRALDDVRESVAELAFYRQTIFAPAAVTPAPGTPVAGTAAPETATPGSDG